MVWVLWSLQETEISRCFCTNAQAARITHSHIFTWICSDPCDICVPPSSSNCRCIQPLSRERCCHPFWHTKGKLRKNHDASMNTYMGCRALKNEPPTLAKKYNGIMLDILLILGSCIPHLFLIWSKTQASPNLFFFFRQVKGCFKSNPEFNVQVCWI